MNMQTGKMNDYILFDEGTPSEYKVYYESTEEKNGLTISFDVKKHHKQAYIDAVKSQLLYFDNIKLFILHENSTEELVPHKAAIIYEDEHIILSDNQYYSKPHILLNKVTYGYVAFDELELEEKIGNIGIKVAPEDVQINVSRESLIWGETTKATILSKFGTVVDIATKFINEELKETDFWKWIKKCYSISARYSEQKGIIGRLAKIVDLTQVDPCYSMDKTVKFKQDLGDYLDFNPTVVTLETFRHNNKEKKAVDRKKVKNLGAYIGLPVFLQENGERASNRKDKYLLSLYPGGFIMMTEPFTHYRERKAEEEMDEETSLEYQRVESDRKKNGWINSRILWKYMLKSSDPIQYNSIEVPKDFSGTEEEEAVEEEQTVEEQIKVKADRQTAEERRKLEGKIIVNTLRANTCYWVSGYDIPLKDRKAQEGAKVYEWNKLEVPIKDINNWSAEEIYYCREDESEMAHFVAMLTRDTDPENKLGYLPVRSYAKNAVKWQESKYYRLNKDEINNVWQAFNCQHFYDAQVMIVKASQTNLKYLRDFSPLQEFFVKIKNSKITMSNVLIKWNTARKVKMVLNNAAFLFNFERFNSEFTNLYGELTHYVNQHYREVEEQKNNGIFGLNETAYSDLLSHLDNVAQFQGYVSSHPEDKEGISILAQTMFGNKDLKDGMAVESEIIDKLKIVLEYARGCGTILNYMPCLTGYSQILGMATEYKPGQIRNIVSLSEEIELEIKQYLEFKGMLNYENVSEKSNFENTSMENDFEVLENSSDFSINAGAMAV